jgi:hypothetical protein
MLPICLQRSTEAQMDRRQLKNGLCEWNKKTETIEVLKLTLKS